MTSNANWRKDAVRAEERMTSNTNWRKDAVRAEERASSSYAFSSSSGPHSTSAASNSSVMTPRRENGCRMPVPPLALIPGDESGSYSESHPQTDPPPQSYTSVEQLREPSEEEDEDLEVHETVRLCDIEAFRANTIRYLNESSSFDEGRDMIYRLTGATWCNLVMLEAIHFELFAPDRPDLRFIAISIHLVAGSALEGDYFLVSGVSELPEITFGVELGDSKYPVVWTTKEANVRRAPSRPDRSELAYVVRGESELKRFPNEEMQATAFCISEFLEDEEWRSIRSEQFDADTRGDHPIRALPIHRGLWKSTGQYPLSRTIIRISTRLTSSAHLYPVEPLRYPQEYLEQIRGIATTATHAGRVVSSARALDAEEKERVDDRLGAYDNYGSAADDALVKSLFRLGSRFRQFEEPPRDDKEELERRIDESVIARTITHVSGLIGPARPLLNCLYGKADQKASFDDDVIGAERANVQLADGSTLQLNELQSRALALCSSKEPPRISCIQSPPGSGKTTIAAAAAAASSPTGRLLLLAMQNVAVNEIATTLKALKHDRRVYNLKATDRLNPFAPAAYDYFDYLSEEEVERWRERRAEVDEKQKRNHRQTRELAERYWQDLDKDRKEFEDRQWACSPPDVLLATVELTLNRLMGRGFMMSNISRIIIDEASLLTEAAFYCVLRRFPEADFVLIGDTHQLPPFLYDPEVLGHRLAGRPALEVAMKSERISLLSLNEIYYAPQSLAEPYNRVAYDRKLISRVPEGPSPLTDLGLVPAGKSQLLFVQVDGEQRKNLRSRSLFNQEEADTLQRLLWRFPEGSEHRIMIVCVYREQWKLVRKVLGPEYAVHTVNSAQGKEMPIVIVLTTRTESAKHMGYFRCKRRCNVAISRQQEALIILGNRSILTEDMLDPENPVNPWQTCICADDFTRVDDQFEPIGEKEEEEEEEIVEQKHGRGEG